ncbi:MAG: hypothetical protein PHI91_03495 [Candidatus Pacebacteria bacterium]|nr:hypothetical protein [Candidatus Paceibacterota bacterium]
MKIYNYKGYKIIKSEMTTTVHRKLPGGSPHRFYQAHVPLYAIEGIKSAGQRPFLVSLRGAKEFINDLGF